MRNLELNQFRDVDVVLDKANDNIIQKQFVSTGDKDGRSLTVQITENGVIGEVTGATLNLYWHNEASGLTDLSAFYVVDKATSVFKIDYPQNMLNPGKVTAYIQILHGGKVTHTKPFEITVQNLAGTTKGVLATAEYSALVTTLAKANELETEIAKKADKTQVDVLGSELDIARGGAQTLGDRLDSDKAEVTAQLAHTTQGLLTNRNAKHALPLPTYEGSGQSVHPSVVNTPASFGGIGLTWYMAHTPYPNTNDEYENPSLLGSVNGEDWVNVGTNPIDQPTPEEIAEGAYMSDPEMIYKDGRLELVYRFNHAGKEVLYRKTSTTGTTWTERELIFDKDTFGHSVMSPSIIYEDGKYRMWTVVPSGTVHYYESITGRLGTWSSPKVVPIQYREGTGTHSPWHISVFKDSDAMYYLVLNAIIPNSTFMRHILIGKSSDGLSFNDTYTLMKPNNDNYAFDNNYLYRAMIVKRKGQYYLYYSAINGDGRWGIGLSKGNTIETIAGFDYRSWNASVSIPRIMTENLSVRGGGVLNNEELLFHTPGVKSVKLKNSFPNELNLLTQQGNPARFLSKEIGLSTGSTGGNIGPSGVQNVLQIRNNANNGPGHLEVAHLLLKDTTNTLNVEGALRYSPTKKKLEFYNGTSWETVTSS